MNDLESLSKLVRSYILRSTTKAGSGHPTSSLSAVELMVGLMFGGGFKYDLKNPSYHNNDRLIFSKGHASPLLYSLWSVAGALSEEQLMTLRKFGSPIEGHPTMEFDYTEVATGSLGQGLSVGLGMAMNARMDNYSYKTYVLLGDSEMAEGSNWEAMQVGAHHKVDNLVGIVDLNRLGQRGETMYGKDAGNLAKKVEAFGWNTLVVDGHDIKEILMAYQQVGFMKDKPTMIVAKTIKGKGASFLEDKSGWHGKVLDDDQLRDALEELGDVNSQERGEIFPPKRVEKLVLKSRDLDEIDSEYSEKISTREAYGHALVESFPKYPNMVVLDAEVSNSTYAETFKKKYPKRFLEMFIAEQNMVGVACGLALRGKIPFVSTFASFFTRAVDQIRVSQYSKANVNFIGSHAGVSIGEDGPTQMGLEDIAIFRSILDSVVLYPCDHVSEEKLVLSMIEHSGICYMRTTRMNTEPIYGPSEKFEIGGSKVLKHSNNDVVTLIGAGVTLYECLKAHDVLLENKIKTRVIDMYSIKPIDVETLVSACKETKSLIVVEDHFAEGGMCEAIRSGLVHESVPIHSLAVRKMPKSGKPDELLEYEEINSDSIINKVYEITSSL
ncbi:transketolase [Patescibacteria group bacterium]